MKLRHFSPQTSTDAEGARDLRLVSAWLAALLILGGAANLISMWFGAGQP